MQREPQSVTLKSGTQLGRYTINSPLGKGGMGEVYRATDTRLGRDVAIKVLSENLSTDQNALKRFQGEAKALATLSHSNIVTIFDVGTDQGISYVVIELLEGKTLRTYLTTAGLPWEKAVEIAIKIAEGLAAAQSKGVVHRVNGKRQRGNSNQQLISSRAIQPRIIGTRFVCISRSAQTRSW